jgi:acetyl-CoA C-acetyltransferase
MTVTMGVADKATGACHARSHHRRRRGHPPGHHARRRLQDPPAIPGGVITAGNASQFSDGASAAW